MTLSNLYYLIVSLQMETENVSDRSNNISVSIGLQNVMDRYGTDQKAIRYNGNIVLVSFIFVTLLFFSKRLLYSALNCWMSFCHFFQSTSLSLKGVSVIFIEFKRELHSNSWNFTFLNKLQFPLMSWSFVFKVSKN